MTNAYFNDFITNKLLNLTKDNSETIIAQLKSTSIFLEENTKIPSSMFEINEDIFIIPHLVTANDLPAHSHDFFEIMYMYKGNCTHTINDSDIILDEGSLCILSPENFHSVKTQTEDDILINILIKKSLFEKSFLCLIADNDLISNFFITSLFALKDSQHYLYFPGANNFVIQNLVQQLIIEYFDKKVCYKKSLECYLALLFAELLRSYQSFIDDSNYKQMGDNKLSDILAYINDNKTTATLKSVSEHFHYHPSYLSSLIKKYTNRSFSDILRELKLKEACQYLSNSNLSIDQIVNVLGYYDVSYFYKTFKKEYNITPNEYRAKLKKPIE